MTIETKFSNCAFRGCLTLENGVIGRCSRAVIAAAIQGFTPNNGDFLLVDGADDFGQKLYHYLKSPRHMKACYHCYGSLGSELVDAAVQT
jgi:hypothetical protein